MAPAGFGDRVEGFHAVEAAVLHGRVRELVVERSRLSDPAVAALVTEADHRGVVVRRVDDVESLAVTSAPQGLVAECRPRRFVSLDELVMGSRPTSLLVLDHVEDPHNLGAMARSAAAAGMPRLVLPARRNAPLGPAAFKAAAGALETCEVAVVSSVADAVRALGGFAVWTVGLDPSGDRSIFGLELLAEPVAIIVGGETGLHRLVRERVDVVAAIPMADGVESLNASVAAALACFEVRRVRAGSIAG